MPGDPGQLGATLSGEVSDRNGLRAGGERPPAPARRADYGIDAPEVVRGLALGGLGALAAAALLHELVGRSRPTVGRLLLGWGALNGLACLASAGLMLWSSRAGKGHELDRLLDGIP